MFKTTKVSLIWWDGTNSVESLTKSLCSWQVLQCLKHMLSGIKDALYHLVSRQGVIMLVYVFC